MRGRPVGPMALGFAFFTFNPCRCHALTDSASATIAVQANSKSVKDCQDFKPHSNYGSNKLNRKYGKKNGTGIGKFVPITARPRLALQQAQGQASALRRASSVRGGENAGRGFGRGLKAVQATTTQRLTARANLAREVLTNAAAWSAVVGGALGWGLQRQDSASNDVRNALVGAVVVSTSLQVASNLLRATWGHGQAMSGTSERDTAEPAGLSAFRWSFLSIYSVCLMAEFIAAPTMWPFLQKNRGLTYDAVFKLGLVTMLSSLVTGLFSGGLIDRYGRKNGCLLWAWLSIAHCLLIRSKTYSVMMLSRVLAGAGGTLLATAFESWMVTEHHRRGYPSTFLPGLFRLTSWTTGLSLIAVGFASQGVVEGAGRVAVFNVAIAMSAVAGLLIWHFWPENYGDRASSASQHTAQAFGRIVGDGRLLMMGIVQVFFEGAMLAWITMWQPCLQGKNKALAAGTVLSTLLISNCGGTAMFKLFTEGLPECFALSPETCLLVATGVGTLVLGLSAMDSSFAKTLGLFLVYETCLGLYSPAMATCRSKYIADDLRTTVMGIFRVPMTMVSALVIIFGVMAPIDPSVPDADAMTHKMPTVFLILAALAGVGTLAQALLIQRGREINDLSIAGSEVESSSGSRAARILVAKAKGSSGTGTSR